MYRRTLNNFFVLNQRLALLSRNVSENVNTTKDNYYKHMNEMQDSDNVKPSGWDEAKPFDTIPGPKPLPLIGNMFRFLPVIGEFHNFDMLDLHYRMRTKYGNVVNFGGIFGRKSMVFLYDPKDFETMFRNEGIWPDRLQLEAFTYYKTVIRKESPGVLILKGEEWFKFRSTVNPILMQPRIAQQYIPNVESVAQDFVAKLNRFVDKYEDGVMPDDFLTELHKWSLETIGTIALETRLGCLDDNLADDSEPRILIKNVLEMFDLMYKLDVLPSFWKYYSTPDFKRFIKCMDSITNVILKYIDVAIVKFEKEGYKPEHEMSALQKLLAKDRKIAITMALDMLIAGIDTTSKTVAAALYFLAKNQDKQQILRDEINRLLPNKTDPITKDTIANAGYLRAVIKETTRLSPIGAGTARCTVKDMVLGGYQIPKGTDMVINNLLLALDDEHFKDAKKFIPERYVRDYPDETLSHKNTNPFVALPFGFGPRSCVGKRLANLEIEMALIKIVQNFEIHWPHAEDAVFGTKLLYGISSPLKLQLKKA